VAWHHLGIPSVILATAGDYSDGQSEAAVPDAYSAGTRPYIPGPGDALRWSLPANGTDAWDSLAYMLQDMRNLYNVWVSLPGLT
jgi:hypothetical protein